MATSGTDNWNPALLDIIRDALLNATAISEDENPTAQDYQSGLRKINNLVKGIEATGVHVWLEEEAILFLQPDVDRYIIGNIDKPLVNANTSDATEWEELTLAQPAAMGDTTITLDTGEGLLVAANQNIGVIDNSGATQWFTVVGDPAGDVITLSGALAVGADAGNFVLVYTTAISRPLVVPKARLLTLEGLNETPMTVLSRQEYMDLPNKRSQGTPTQFFYSPRRDQGLLYIWPVAQQSAWAVRFTWYRSIQDFLVPTNTMDFPQEWINALTWNLAKEVAPSYGVPERVWQRIVTMADAWALTNIAYDRESEPIQFGMDYWQYDSQDY